MEPVIKSCPGFNDCKLKGICRRHDMYKHLSKNECIDSAREKWDAENNRYVCGDFIMSEFYGN